MANKNIGNATAVAAMLKENSIFIEVGGSLRRITLEKFMSTLNTDQEQLLQSMAWGIPLKYGVQSSPEWGMVGNLSAFNSYRAKVGRYAVESKSDGVVRARKCHPNDSSMLVDGTAVATDGTQSVMVIAPRLYILVRSGDSYPTLWMSEYPISKHYLATTADGNYIVAGAYKGRVINGKLVSVAGGMFGANATISKFWEYAQAFNTGAGIIDYAFWRWFCAMCLSESGGNANAQASLGYGPGGNGITWSTFNASSTLTMTGLTSSLGDATGKVDISTDDGGVTNSCHVSVACIEDFWNSQREMVQGLYCGCSSNDAQDGTEVFIYSGNRMPSSTELTTNPAGSYRKLTRPLTSGNYIKSIIGGEYFDVLADTPGGNSTTYLCDAMCSLKTSETKGTGVLVLVGGCASGGARSGPFSVRSDGGWSSAWSSFGARPAFYGTVEFV